ncbi:HelD family protein [Paenibacillus lutimineralis]|uniref:DNA 3'-5' helicase n=1 Tax=Paenibacillus lutimineralis TaxID=2707005 RepID=A0A3Q9IBH1_9BACL|nr:3'-5' exonuclease [Paenibacillus lutimineralis]AZS16953.1 DNA helicase UvrD [Paenibacillus lutimineralis]
MSEFQSAYQEEERKLDRALASIDDQLQQLRSIPVYIGDDFTEQALEASREGQRQKLIQSAQEPYFGRLDFEESGREFMPLYIGKAGVSDTVGKQPMVIDWRAPVASLFYSFTGGDSASYEAPEGLIEGKVSLKRNIVIRQRKLERVVDTFNENADTPGVSDEFLVYRLGENKDNRLRDIVSTIQAEQDQIIRALKNTALIIQGVAGSGKTTVALHRLAYLLYQYKEQIRAERMVIFAPNLMFIDYISEVLPELGVGDIQQCTFTDWAAKVIGLMTVPADGSAGLMRWFDDHARKQEIRTEQIYPGRYKGSMEFKNLLDDYLLRIEAECVPQVDFEPWDGNRLSRAEILEWFEGEYKYYPVARRKERLLARIHRWVEMELKKSPSAAALKERKKKAQQREKAYAKKWPELDSFQLYRNLFQMKKNADFAVEDLQARIPAAVWKETKDSLKNGTVQEDDLAALLYLFAGVNELDSTLTFDHIVIDEAQDFSPFQVAVLDRFVKGHSFTILGDLSQGIHYYKGIDDWQEMQGLFAQEETAYFALTRSYRSTMEIIEYANEILKRGVGTDLLAVPVFRSGDPVRLEHAQSGESKLKLIKQALTKVLNGEYRTTAILTRTLDEAKQMYESLTAEGLIANLIDGDKTQYAGGISVLPVYLSKGLEFDAVIVTDVDAQHYGPQDAKLLYVGCTRALHELWLLYGDQIPEYVVTEV